MGARREPGATVERTELRARRRRERGLAQVAKRDVLEQAWAERARRAVHDSVADQARAGEFGNRRRKMAQIEADEAGVADVVRVVADAHARQIRSFGAAQAIVDAFAFSVRPVAGAER